MTENESKLDQLLRQRAEVDELLRRHQTDFSVLFTDVVGSTAYFERYGDIAGVAMLSRHENVARKAIEEHSGRVIKNIGDSVMAEFSDPAAAARAAVEIQRRLMRANLKLPENERIQIRIGINHGIGFRHEGDVYGDVVNVAARITKHTGPAQILVSTSVQQAVADASDLRCNFLGKVAMKGKSEEGDVYEIVWTDTRTYVGLRQDVTMALRRGQLTAPGLDMNELIPTSPPTPPPAPPVESLRRDSVYATPAPGSLESRYEILGELGSGGMGVVYKARDRETSDLVAIKMLRPEIAADEKGLQRFKNELRVARRITHKNVCRIHEFNRTETSAYITMEYVEGESLRHVLNRFGSLGLPKGVQIARQICSGLREAHAQGVVHRDLKPENVMLDTAGDVKIMDFGIAHAPVGAGLTQTHAVIGTPSYMSPEQAQGQPLNNRSDIYAVGLILYEMFTGSPTFTAENPVAIAVKHIREMPVPPRNLDVSIPENINAAIMKCLEKDPGNRFSDVAELAAALLEGLPQEAMPEMGLRTGEVLVPPASTPIPAPAYYSPTPYGTQPPPPPMPAPPPQVTQPTAAEALRAPTAEVPVAAKYVPPAAAAPAKKSNAAVLIIVGVLLLVGSIGAYGLYRFLRTPRSPEQQTQAPTQQTAPSTDSQTPPQASKSEAGQPSTVQPPPSTTDSASAPPTKQPAAPGSRPSGTAPPPTTSAPPPAAPVGKISVGFALGQTLAGHTAAVTAVAFSSDGRYVVTGSRDRTVRIWEAGTGRSVQTLKGHRDSVSSVAFSPDGRHVASGSSDRTVVVWDIGGGQPVATLPKENAPVNCVAFSPDGRLLAYSTSEGRIKVWDISSGEGVATLDGHAGPVYSIVFSPDGRLLASGGRDQTARLWNIASQQETRVFNGHSDAVNAVLFSPDGRWLATASDDQTARLWEVSSGRALRTFSGHSGGVDGLAFGSDGRWLAAGGEDKVVKVWDTASGEELTTLSGHIYAITDLAVTRNGRWLASAAGDNTVRLWRRE